MAGDCDEDKEYESDPEDAKMSLKMRRREASDDEEVESVEGGGAAKESEREKLPAAARVGVDSDGESDDQGGACEYDEELDDEDYYDDEYEEEYEEVGEDEGLKAVEGEAMEERVVDLGMTPELVELSEGASQESGGQIQGEEVKKENEPFAVPTAGAFYMHDDRFRDNVGGRHRRTLDGRKLWESKDNQKWGHDKFEEVNMQDRHYEQNGRKPPRGRSRGRGRGRGTDRRYVRGNSRLRTYNENNSENPPPKAVRGRGPRRYQPLTKHRYEALTPQNTASRRSIEKTSHASSGRVDTSFSNNKEAELVAPKKVASNLNSASPPFYPSGSTNKEIGVTQKRDVQSVSAGTANRIFHTSAVKDKLPFQQSNPLMREKFFVDSNGMQKLSIDDTSSVRPSPKMHVPPPFLTTNGSQGSQRRGQGRAVLASGPNSFPASSSQDHFNKVPTTSAHVLVNQSSAQAQASLPVLAPNLGHRSGSVSLGSSPPRSGLSISVIESGDSASPESSKLKASLAGKGKGTIQGGGRDSFVYGGNQVGSTGAMGSGHIDSNFAGTPSFLPVMQFGAQHPGGIGVPAVGMAFPGYVANPQLGLGNSEMTWLPVLAGAAGALGGSYCPPYIAVDGSYNARPAGNPPVLAASSKDNSSNLAYNDRKSEQKPEVTSDEFNQRQNKPRRYSEMSFSQ